MEKVTLADIREFKESSFTKRVLFKREGNIVFILNFLPGQSLPVHKHPGADVYILVTGGSGEMHIDDSIVEAAEGDVIYVGGEESFSFANTGEGPASLYVTLTKIPDERYAQDVGR